MFAASVDLFPTFLDAAKVKAPPHVLIDGMMMIVMMMNSTTMVKMMIMCDYIIFGVMTMMKT